MWLRSRLLILASGLRNVFNNQDAIIKQFDYWLLVIEICLVIVSWWLVIFMTELQKSVIAAVVYFDIFDYPLTLTEVKRYLGSDIRSRMLEVRECLYGLKDKVSEHRGFYFLRNRQEIVNTRIKRYNIAERKYKRALWVSKILSWLPHVRMIAVCNNLAYSNAHEASDIDLLIAAKAGRIWSCRFFILLILKLLGLRPRPSQTKDKICASFFVAEDNLNLESIKLKNDVYLHYWLEQVAPIYDENVYDDFRRANAWNVVRGYGADLVSRRKLRNYEIKKLWKRVSEKLFLGLDERFYRRLQMRIMPRKLKEIMNKDTRVAVNDRMLKFHENDRREYYGSLFKDRMQKIADY